MIRLYVAIAIGVLAAAIFAGGYLKGKSDGRIDQLQDSVKAYEKRNGIDEQVQGATRFDLCVSLGGLPDECRELLGLDQAAEAE